MTNQTRPIQTITLFGTTFRVPERTEYVDPGADQYSDSCVKRGLARAGAAQFFGTLGGCLGAGGLAIGGSAIAIPAVATALICGGVGYIGATVIDTLTKDEEFDEFDRQGGLAALRTTKDEDEQLDTLFGIADLRDGKF